jgi:hypothetical protein
MEIRSEEINISLMICLGRHKGMGVSAIVQVFYHASAGRRRLHRLCRLSMKLALRFSVSRSVRVERKIGCEAWLMGLARPLSDWAVHKARKK